jgi:glycosyltransferase involved in cell wall biosynthesis
LYINKKSVNIRRVLSRIPENADLDYILRMKLFDALNSYMTDIHRDDFMVKLTPERDSYRVHLERLDGTPYDTPGEFIDDYICKYNSFSIPNCNLELEFEIDEE